jgi:SAM-dependent methyltransferase
MRRFYGASVAYPYYRLQLTSYVSGLLPREGACAILDVGAGDGRLGALLRDFRPHTCVVALETNLRANLGAKVPFIRFDGKRIPLGDRSADVAILSNVLHHADDPGALLAEVCRVTRRRVIIKDHLSRGLLDDLLLGALDVLGNRRFGAPTDAVYLSAEGWEDLFAAVGTMRVQRLNRLSFRRIPLSLIFSNRLEVMFVLDFDETAI